MTENEKNKGEPAMIDVGAVLKTIDPTGDDLRVRVEAQRQAHALIEANLGRLTESQLRALMKHINTGWGRNGIVYNRFSPGFVGQNANQLVSALPRLNPLIEKLWTAPHNGIAAVVDAFFEEEIPGAGRSFPTAILHIRDPKLYAVWTRWLDEVLRRQFPEVEEHSRDGAGYVAYCEAIRRLCERYQVPANLSDKAIFRLDAARPATVSVDTQASDFVGFSTDTFSFMAELEENNTDAWFTANRERFREAVDRPLRSLVDDIGARVIHSVDPSLETSSKSGKALAKIRKNVWGKKPTDGYHTLYWAAFYRKQRTKQTDAQLFMTIRGRGFSHGLYLPPTAEDVVARIRAVCSARPVLVRTILAALAEDGFRVAGTDDDHNPPKPEVVKAPEELEKILAGGALHVFKELSPEDAVQAGRRLALEVGDDLRQLYPLFALATNDDVPDDIVRFLRDEDAEDEGEEVPVSGGAVTLAQLAERTYLKPEFFDRLERLLADKRQLIFSGPPGTGKTLVALEYARFLAQKGGEVATVQFHPSYGYEDFVEGLRPVVENGHLQYRVDRGIFRLVCDKARANPKARFVLLVDEINRGNLPRIFGELLFLLERRDQSVLLPYSKQTFSVPENVIVLGTMNTADRSIALLDIALRRRFHFVDMEPQPEVLRAWLDDHDHPAWIADLLTTLNEELARAGIDPGRMVGHAHFMSRVLDAEHVIRIWEATIEPLLGELFFSEPAQLERFTLERLRKPMKVATVGAGAGAEPAS